MKRFLCLITVLSLLFCLAGCGGIEDTNGPDDFSLVTITDEDICSGKLSYSAMMSSTTNINNKLTLKIRKFSGVKEPDSPVARVKTNGETLIFRTDITVTAGNFRACIVRDNEEIVGEFPIDVAGEVRIENAVGTYSLRIAGESAAFSLVCTLEKE